MHWNLTRKLLTAIIAMLTFSCDNKGSNKNTEEAGAAVSPVIQQRKGADKAALIGDWTRTDAPYRLTISELTEDGMMKTGYFNPKSIHVGKATWAAAGGVFKIYIELSDVNYPGSNYNLTYIPGRDILAGKYFQAVEGITYDVGFQRIM